MAIMPNSGVDLGADLYDLWKAGKGNLPAVAREFVSARSALDRSEQGLSSAFMRPAEFGGGTYGPVYAPWTQLRDTLEKILSDTANHLEQAAEALCLAATEYARTDSAAKAEFDRLRREYGEPHP
jgi:hypothetical protein